LILRSTAETGKKKAKKACWSTAVGPVPPIAQITGSNPLFYAAIVSDVGSSKWYVTQYTFRWVCLALNLATGRRLL